MRAVIADDEPIARANLRELLAGVVEVEIVGEAASQPRTSWPPSAKIPRRSIPRWRSAASA